MTNIPMNYIGEEPMYMSGSLYLSFPSLGNTAGDCQLPSTSEEMMGALPDAYFLRPNGADPIKVWPSKFVLELFGTRVRQALHFSRAEFVENHANPLLRSPSCFTYPLCIYRHLLCCK